MQIRDRIKELRRVKANELVANPRNWRTHPESQKAALSGLLQEIGFAGAELARELSDGTLMLIDGHCRAELAGDSEIPVLVLDVDEDEADKILATFDPIGAMATANTQSLSDLLSSISSSNAAVQSLLSELADNASQQAIDAMADMEIDDDEAEDDSESPTVNLFSCPVTVEEELVIRRAIAKSKRENGAVNTTDALLAIMEQYNGEG